MPKLLDLESRELETGDPLMDVRPKLELNPAEQGFSRLLQIKLEKLLEGRSNQMLLMTIFPADEKHIQIFKTPTITKLDSLRLKVIKGLVMDVLDFMRAEETVSGVGSQKKRPDGGVTDLRIFPTRYSHILIERRDEFEPGAQIPESITWNLQRVQNQQLQTKVGLGLDAVQVGMKFAGFLI